MATLNPPLPIHSISSATPLTEDPNDPTNLTQLNAEYHHPLRAISSIRRTLTGVSKHKSQFVLTPTDLAALHDPKSLKVLSNLGGFEHLLNSLRVVIPQGLNPNDESDYEDREHSYGRNRLPLKQAKSFFRLCFEAMKDEVLIILSVAAVVSLALGLYETFGEGTFYDDEGVALPKVDWVEGVAILVAIIIVVIVGAGNDYQKERQFARLNAKKEDKELIVIRNGEQIMISVYDLVVGDLLNLQTGDIVCADCILYQGEIECDESSVTGESDSLRKVSVFEAESKLNPDDEESHSLAHDPFLISGSKVLSGLGNALVTAVGENSMHGRTMMALNIETESTPLTDRLNKLAEGISKYGFLAALLLFVILFIRFIVNIAPGGIDNGIIGSEKGKKFLDILITAITIIVVAIPEGLPLAVTLSLAFATTRMAKNGNLVRVLKSCETMGGATVICSDKTGTLTENKMRITQAFFGLNYDQDAVIELDKATLNPTEGIVSPVTRKTTKDFPIVKSSLDIIITNIVSNSTAFKNASYDPEKYALLKQRPKSKSFFSKFSTKEAPKPENPASFTEPFLGNKTESALLILAQDEFKQFTESSLEKQRAANTSKIVQIIPFESERKWSGIVMKTETGFRFYAKGAAEILFKKCGYQFDNTGILIPLSRELRDLSWSKIDEYTNDALRAIALVHFDYEGTVWPPAELVKENAPIEGDDAASRTSHRSLAADADLLVNLATNTKNLTLDCMVGISDPLKPGVAEAVLQCKKAGVQVKMLTGDNLITAKAISQGCGILSPDDLTNQYACMEGPVFRALSKEERTRIAPKLKVLARSSPEDKRILVETLKELREVVAVTGDGTNDAPALKLADVGFSMGISGTEVAREASDIILMTDDFTDIVQAIKWGRTVAVSIKKFIQFQLTVNITACVLTFVSAVASSHNQSVLTAVQLLWVNLIMDTLAALALATDKPDDSFLTRKPAGRTAPLISVSMWKMILGQSITQLTITFVLHFAGAEMFYGTKNTDNHQDKQLDAMTFNTFVWLQFWKLFVTRKLDEADGIRSVKARITRNNLDFSQDLFRNWYFLVIALIIGGTQILIMFVGGAAFSIAGQSPAQWATAMICGSLSIPAGILIRICPDEAVLAIFPERAFKVFIHYAGFSWLKKSGRKAHRDRNEPEDVVDDLDLELEEKEDEKKKPVEV